MTTNGNTPDFTHHLGSFTLEGQEFRRRKIPAKLWADTLAEVAGAENAEIEKTEGSVLFAVSAEGLYRLVRLGIVDDDRPAWDTLWDDGLLEFGELVALREWIWEQMTERPFMSPTPSSDGRGSDNARSSKDESSSPVETPAG